MDSVSVVFPESMCAKMPMFLMVEMSVGGGTKDASLGDERVRGDTWNERTSRVDGLGRRRRGSRLIG